jgi:hypothetical protein
MFVVFMQNNFRFGENSIERRDAADVVEMRVRKAIACK